MAKVTFVKRARKENPVAKKGESYYWWQFAFQPKMYSKTPPTRSQTVRSPFYQQLYALEDSVGSYIDPDSVQNDFIPELEQLRDEQEEARENMPEGLQESATGELLQERFDGLDNWITEIESELDNYPNGDLTEEEREDAWQNIMDVLEQGASL